MCLNRQNSFQFDLQCHCIVCVTVIQFNSSLRLHCRATSTFMSFPSFDLIMSFLSFELHHHLRSEKIAISLFRKLKDSSHVSISASHSTKYFIPKAIPISSIILYFHMDVFFHMEVL